MDPQSPTQSPYSSMVTNGASDTNTNSSNGNRFTQMFKKDRSPVLFVLLFAIIGTILLLRSLAATPSATKVWATNADWNAGSLNSVTVANNSVSLAPAASTAPASNPDLALNRPVVASSVESSTQTASLQPHNIVDGSLTTRWASTQGVDPQWIYVDLGSSYNINEVNLNWETAYAKAYQVQVSNDASTWKTIYSTTAGTGGVNDLTGLSGSGRYVRIYGTVRATQWGYSLWEVNVFGTPAGTTSSNLALAKPVKSSSNESSSYPASNAVDGNTSTRWASAQGVDPQWIYVDLGNTYNVNEVKLNWERAYAKAYQVQVSNDASTWKTIYSTSSGTGGTNDLTGLSGVGRYVRIYGTVRGTKWGYSLWEISVFGTVPTSQSYVSSGSVTESFDAGATVNWSTLTPVSNVPSGTNITYQARTSADNSTWSAWNSDITQVASTRYIQVQANLSTTDPVATPTLNSLTLGYDLISPTPTMTLTATPSAIVSGQSSTLTWASTNATACTASGAWSGSKATSGTASTGTLSATSTYNLSCTGSGGTANASTTVTVSTATGGGGSGPGCTTDGCLVNTLFTAAGPIASPIPANPVIDPNSSHFVSELAAGTPGGNVLGTGPTTTWGITYYYSTASDPTYNINFVHTGDWGGGVNPFSKTVTAKNGSGSCNPLHIPNDATVPGGFAQASNFSTGSQGQPDSSMWIIDQTKPGLACFIWQATKQTGTWSGSFGGVFDTNGNGVQALAGLGVGSGMSNNSPLESEIQNGVIPHAMNFAWTGNAPGVFRYPATHTDGRTSGDMVEGMRFQLNPSFNCAGLATKAARVICVALQQYGMYDGDSGGGGVSFQVQTDDFTDAARNPWTTPGEPGRPGGIYCNAGLCSNGANNLGIPLNQFRLLNTWNGS